MSVLDALLVCPSCGALPIDWTQRPTNVWQPIDTAPQDGDEFLAFWPPNYFGFGHLFEGQYFPSVSSDADPWAMPTHWQPVPPGPTP